MRTVELQDQITLIQGTLQAFPYFINSRTEMEPMAYKKHHTCPLTLQLIIQHLSI